jgi:FkbM family methyltransferase
VFSLKNEFIKKCPDWLFVPISNTYYALSLKEKVKIKKVNGKWLVQKGEIELLSPTPKFLGFGFKEFEDKCERFFKIEKGDTTLDVGACIGDTTVPMAIKTGSTGKVIAVEPHPFNVEFLKLNLADFNNVEIVNKAVWNEKGTVKFHVHKTPTGHSILEGEERDTSIEVPSDTLDNMFGDRKIDFAKIDVQGAEVQVLEGGDRFLETTRKLVVETHARFDVDKRTYPKVMEILKKYNYEIRFAEDNGVVYAWK